MSLRALVELIFVVAAVAAIGTMWYNNNIAQKKIRSQDESKRAAFDAALLLFRKIIEGEYKVGCNSNNLLTFLGYIYSHLGIAGKTPSDLIDAYESRYKDVALVKIDADPYKILAVSLFYPFLKKRQQYIDALLLWVKSNELRNLLWADKQCDVLLQWVNERAFDHSNLKLGSEHFTEDTVRAMQDDIREQIVQLYMEQLFRKDVISSLEIHQLNEYISDAGGVQKLTYDLQLYEKLCLRSRQDDALGAMTARAN